MESGVLALACDCNPLQTEGTMHSKHMAMFLNVVAMRSKDSQHMQFCEGESSKQNARTMRF